MPCAALKLETLSKLTTALPPDVVGGMKGHAGIAHVRYPTAGPQATRNDAQPFITRRPGILLAHNGNVTNIPELSRTLREEGWHVLSQCDAEPILLPEGVVIDLDGSAVPDNWRPPAGAAETVPYSNRMDLLFSPRGTVTGPEAAAGLLHFYLTTAADVDDSFVILGRAQVNQGGSPGIPGDGQFSTDRPIGDRALVSVFTQTGKVSAFPLNTTDSDSDGYADDPFSQVTRGKGLTQ